MHVLFVDDDELVSQSVEEALRRAGHSCEIAKLGSEAITLAKANTYDIVVLDIGLPDMDGYHVIRRLKLESIRVPILLQSGLSDPDLVAEGAELGVEDFLPKPFSIKELVAHMESVVARSGIGAPDVASEADATPAPEPVSVPESSAEVRPEPAPAPAQAAVLQPAAPLVNSPGPEPVPQSGHQVDPAPDGRAAPEPEPQAAGTPAHEAMPELAEPAAPPAPSGAERRIHERVPTFGAALIKDGGDVPIPCAILDESVGGAALRLSDEDQVCPTRFTLEPFDGPVRRCEVRWRRGDRIGVEYI